MGKMEVEPSQSLMPSRSTREPSQVCAGGSSHTVQQGFHPQSPQNQLRSLLGTRWWRKEVLHLVFWEHHMTGKGWEMAWCSQISDHKAGPPPVGLSREEGNPENYQQCFPIDNFQSLTGRMTLYFSSGSFNMLLHKRRRQTGEIQCWMECHSTNCSSGECVGHWLEERCWVW